MALTGEAKAAIEALETGSDAGWIGLGFGALLVVHGMRADGEDLTTDAVWHILERRKVPPPGEPRAMAAVMLRAQRAGLIEPTDRMKQSQRRENHGRRILVWRVRKPA